MSKEKERCQHEWRGGMWGNRDVVWCRLCGCVRETIRPMHATRDEFRYHFPKALKKQSTP